MFPLICTKIIDFSRFFPEMTEFKNKIKLYKDLLLFLEDQPHYNDFKTKQKIYINIHKYHKYT